jgi:hypothetical protein
MRNLEASALLEETLEAMKINFYILKILPQTAICFACRFRHPQLVSYTNGLFKIRLHQVLTSRVVEDVPLLSFSPAELVSLSSLHY